MDMDRETLEPLVRQIISEILAESAPAPAAPPAAAAGPATHPMELRVHPDGTVVVRRAAPGGDPSGAGMVVSPEFVVTCCPPCTCCTCICTCICCCQCGACIEFGQALQTTTYESRTEEVFTRILRAEPMGRDQLITHLWERVQKRLVHEEAVSFHAEQLGGGQALPAPADAEESQ